MQPTGEPNAAHNNTTAKNKTAIFERSKNSTRHKKIADKRGIEDDPILHIDIFIEFYSEFHAEIANLITADQNRIKDELDEIIDGESIGSLIVEAEDPEEVKEQIVNLQFEDKKLFMEYLVKEKAIVL